MRPRQTKVLLFVILVRAFAGNDVVGEKLLPRVLPAGREIVCLARVPVETSGIVARRKIKSLLTAKHSWTSRRIVGHSIRKPIDDALNEGAICGRIVRRVCINQFAGIAFRQGETRRG